MSTNTNDTAGTSLRTKTQNLRNRLAVLRDDVSGAIQSNDLAHLATFQGTIAQLAVAIRETKAEFKAASLSDELTNELDQTLTFLETGISSLKNDLNRASRDTAIATVDVPTVVTREVLQTLDTKKDEEIVKLADNVKMVAVVNNRITEKLDEGAEIMEDVDTGIIQAQEKIGQTVDRMKLFQSYMKKTKVPSAVCILSFILMIIVWSSKAFCSWGFTWQCP